MSGRNSEREKFPENMSKQFVWKKLIQRKFLTGKMSGGIL